MGTNLLKEKLLTTLNDKLNNLSEQEVKALIDKESEKNPDEINMDYIDFCYELLAAKKNKPSQMVAKKSNHKKIRVKRILTAAAVVIIFVTAALTVSAYMFDFNIPSHIARLIDGNAEIDPNLKDADTTADGYLLSDTVLAKQLADLGVTPITLPEELIKKDSSIISIENVTDDKTVSTDIYIRFKYHGYEGYLSVSKSNKDLNWLGEDTVINVDSARMISVNGMDILVFEQNGNCSIIYKDRLTKYNISLECEMDVALEFAKSIK